MSDTILEPENLPPETRALFKDLLSSVTNFFRDPKAFEAIEREVVPQIFEGKRSTDHVRIWIVGCATGEEAYSLAMLIAEQMIGIIDAPRVQIFATDINEAALAVAREGLYTINDVSDLPPDRLGRFFTKEGDHYRVKSEIREMILFVYHDVLKDPPLIHLDLVSCRNLLIYLNTAAQERILGTFHFALNPGGKLFLGMTESNDGAGDLFSPVNEGYRIYQSRVTEVRRFPLPDLTLLPHPQRTPAALTSNGHERHDSERITNSGLHQQLLEQYAPPSVVINFDFEIVHLSERVGQYLKISGGAPSMNLLKVVSPELRPEMLSALHQAVREQTNIVARDLEVEVEGHIETLDIHIRPVLRPNDPARGFILVLFDKTGEVNVEKEDVSITTDPVSSQLEVALMRMRARLHRAIEQYEVQAEELKSSNEVLQAMNKEQLAATEELVTSKEELQAINEELRTVNEELKSKIEETTLGSNNLNNFINSTDIGTIFLDRNFCVQLFTPAAREIFNLIPADSGRVLTDITHRLAYHGLIDDVHAVLNNLQVVEREVRAVDDRIYLMRVMPYRTADDQILGVIVSFVDITKRKRAEIALLESEERLRVLVESVHDYAIFTIDHEGLVTSWNEGARRIMGYSAVEIIGQPVTLFYTAEDVADGKPGREMEAALAAGRSEDESWRVRKDQSLFWCNEIVTPLRTDDGALLGFTKISRDLTERKRLEDGLRRAHDELEERVRERTLKLAELNTSLETEVRERRAAEGRVKSLLKQLVKVQEVERQRLSRELHDSFGQQLTALRLGIDALTQPGAKRTSRQGDELRAIIKQLDRDVDFLAHQLRPAALDELGLVSAVANFTEEWSKVFGIPADFHTARLSDDRLTSEIETNLYRITQEALNNVAKHAQASHVAVVLERCDGHLTLIIEDNGVGMTLGDDALTVVANEGLGLIGMRERATLIGGELEIESTAGEGTTIYVRLPIRFQDSIN